MTFGTSGTDVAISAPKPGGREDRATSQTHKASTMEIRSNDETRIDTMPHRAP